MEDGLNPEIRINKKERKAKEKAEKKEAMLERRLLGYERALLAWIRTSAHLMTFGFAIYKLLQQRAKEPGAHPVMEVISPKVLGLVMVFSGFVGLVMAIIRYLKGTARYGTLTPKTYYNPTMIQAYVVLILSVLLIVGALIGS